MKDLKKLSRRLSWLLRHGANEVGLSMDAAGWVAVSDVMRHLRVSDEALEACVATNNKQRFQVDGTQIRACQGHSTEGTPVTADALEASWHRVVRTDPLFHGTTPEAVTDIANSGGLRPMARTHVHLAGTPHDKVGKRANVGVLLVVDPQALTAAGQSVFQSPNGVFLVRTVPWECVTDVRTLSRRAQAQRAWLRGHLTVAGGPGSLRRSDACGPESPRW
ncbi:MAG: tRNA 2'-phosphotransferase [Myxococcota bacterium]